MSNLPPRRYIGAETAASPETKSDSAAGLGQGNQWADLESILLPCRAGAEPSTSSFVATVGTRQALRAAALAISQQRPVLLEGPPGEMLCCNIMLSLPCEVCTLFLALA